MHEKSKFIDLWVIALNHVHSRVLSFQSSGKVFAIFFNLDLFFYLYILNKTSQTMILLEPKRKRRVSEISQANGNHWSFDCFWISFTAIWFC